MRSEIDEEKAQSSTLSLFTHHLERYSPAEKEQKGGEQNCKVMHTCRNVPAWLGFHPEE